MIMELHLFSTPGEGEDIRWVVEASRPYLEKKSDPMVAYLPLASLFGERTLEATQKSFKGLAQVELINTETMDQTEMEAILRRAALAYIPGGNTFLLNHRLQVGRLHSYLRKKVQSGLPLVAFSAGTILCSPNIITANDMNSIGTPHFDGLNLTPFNFFVHYGMDGYGGAVHDNWLRDYHVFHDNPIIILADGAYVRIDRRETKLMRGDAWLLRQGQERERIDPDTAISA